MSHSNTKPVDRRSNRRLQSQNSEKTSQNINQHVDSTDPEEPNFSATTQKDVHVKMHDEDDLILSKSEEEKETRRNMRLATTTEDFKQQQKRYKKLRRARWMSINQ